MGTQVASRSGQLAQPGAPLDEPDEAPPIWPTMDALPPPVAIPTHTNAHPRSDDARAREVRWVCEWWPPS